MCVLPIQSFPSSAAPSDGRARGVGGAVRGAAQDIRVVLSRGGGPKLLHLYFGAERAHHLPRFACRLFRCWVAPV